MIGKPMLLLLIVPLIFTSLYGIEANGTIKGKIVDQSNGMAIPGVLIQIQKTNLTAVSNESGAFGFNGVEPGSYNLQISMDGFRNMVKNDVIVYPNRITHLEIPLQEELIHLKKTINVRPSYFPKDEKKPNSTFNMTAEEVRRAPGSSGDVSRMLRSLPGVSVLNDTTSDLIVRGGSPTENAFFIENIEIPNINHFPSFGSTGGLYSAINSDMLHNIDFYTGGFPAQYGDRLSSVIDMTLREGNKYEFDGLISADLMQVGAILEGPISKGKGSFIISGRICAIKALQDIGIISFPEGFSFPSMSDIQAKISFDLSPTQYITLLNVLGLGDFGIEDDDVHMNMDYTQNSSGINWRSVWSKNFISNTSLSYAYIKQGFDFNYEKRGEEGFEWKNSTNEGAFSLRNLNYLEFKNNSKLEFGIQVKHETFDQNWHIGEFSDDRGWEIPAGDRVVENLNLTKSALFASYTFSLFNRFTTTMGLRGDYSSLHKRFHLSPRFSFNYNFNNQFSVHGGLGLFYQTLPLFIYADHPEFKSLRDQQAVHYILGFEYLNNKGLKLTLEVYDKEYKYLTINPDYPYRLITDRLAFEVYYPTDKLEDVGLAYSRGIELFVQQKLVKNLYGLFSATYFKSRYKDYFGDEHDRIYDNRYIVNLMAGWRPGKKWEFSLRWTIMGGAPYTPINKEASIAAEEEIRDQSQFNLSRYPDYNSLNLRVEFRSYTQKAGLIVYIDVSNLLNAKNIFYYYWNSEDQEIKPIYQLPIFPKIGFEFRF